MASSQAGTSLCWLVLRNQPARLGLRTQPRRLGLTGDPAPMARSWDPAMQASSPPRTSLHRWFLRTSPAGWVSPQTLPRRLGPENQPAWRSNAVLPAMATSQPVSLVVVTEHSAAKPESCVSAWSPPRAGIASRPGHGGSAMAGRRHRSGVGCSLRRRPAVASSSSSCCTPTRPSSGQSTHCATEYRCSHGARPRR